MENEKNKNSNNNFFPLNHNNNNSSIEKFINKNKNFHKESLETLFRIFISIYYYENYFKLDNSLILYENYYLINPDWMNKLKENYNYQQLYYSLNSFIQKNPKINYSILNMYIEKIIEYYINDNIFNFEKLEFSEELKKTPIEIKSNEYYFIDSNILNLIIECKNLESKQLLYLNNDNIYLKYKNNIIIGTINNKLIFIPKFNINYKSSNILESEKNLLFRNKIEEYLKKRNFNKNYQKKLINENNEEIGEFIHLLKEKITAKNKNNSNKPIYINNIIIFPNSNNNINNNFLYNMNNNNNILTPKKSKVKKKFEEIVKIEQNNQINDFPNDNYKKNNNLNLNNNYRDNNKMNNKQQNYIQTEQIENELKYQIELNEEIKTKNNELENQINQLNNKINKLNMDITIKNNEINFLKNNNNKNEAHQELINKLNNTNNELILLKNENNELKKQIKNKNELINNLNYIKKQMIIN